jgi:hypothetical protein
MTEVLVQFIVLGQLPGTTVQVNFIEALITVSVCALLFVANVSLLRKIRTRVSAHTHFESISL